MGLFGRRKWLGGAAQSTKKVGGSLTWMQAIQEAKIKNSLMNDLKNIYQDNQRKLTEMVKHFLFYNWVTVII